MLSGNFNTLLFGLILLGLNSCQKDIDIFTPYDNQTLDFSELDGAIADFFISAQVPVKQFSLDAATGAEIVTDRQSLVNIPQQAFETEEGEEVSGEISVMIQEGYTKAELVRWQKPSTYNNELYQSLGVISIEVSQNGKQLRIKEGSTISVNLSLSGLSEFTQLFWAEASSDRYFNWQGPAVNAQLREEVYSPIGQPLLGLGFQISQTGIYGVLSPLTDNLTNTTTFCAKLPEGYAPDNTSVFFVGADEKPLLVELEWTLEAESYLFCFGNMPVGNEGQLLAITQWEDGINALALRLTKVESGVQQQLLIIPDLSSFQTILSTLEDL